MTINQSINQSKIGVADFDFTVVFGVDSKYLLQLITTIKSICCFHRRVKFYVLNRDIPEEFFKDLNLKLALFNSVVIDVKVTNQQIKAYKTYQHISSDSTFFRYFISDLIPENKVLYLDADLIISKPCFNDFWQIDLGKYPLAGVKDIILFAHTGIRNFNAGVLLINNAFWRENNLTKKFLKLTDKYHNKVKDADQSILNMFFNDDWVKLDRNLNYLIGVDVEFKRECKTHLLEDLAQAPAVIHFNTFAKPWLHTQVTRFRNLWWYYSNLEWSEVLNLNNSHNCIA